ncbi:hypothetical protein PHAVU_006G159800 [Phaseolus vulgaris]|uniref:Uncharacterized protein n=1 Tax=Phaseolus vulgaris TaxID=3885 RepID=V7BTE0_PHAVU|nr:hypothetical protein PHAVU_006G159800g [Phaseolus vulgaris]ESW19841.1 hypothetical protein PHAVU_006G159800g [Phaseolus vulgaris]
MCLHLYSFLKLILGFISLNHPSSPSRPLHLALISHTNCCNCKACDLFLLFVVTPISFCLMQQQESPGFSILWLHCLLQLLGLWGSLFMSLCVGLLSYDFEFKFN